MPVLVFEDTGKLAALRTMGSPASDEADLVREFLHMVEAKKPRLAGWNTNGYDLPLLVAWAMAHRIPVPGFYRVGAP